MVGLVALPQPRLTVSSVAPPRLTVGLVALPQPRLTVSSVALPQRRLFLDDSQILF